MIALAASPTDLIESHVWLAREEFEKRRVLRQKVGDDEVLSAAMFALCQAANRFVVDRQGSGGFVAYARQAIRNRLKDCEVRKPTRAWLNISSFDREHVTRDGEGGREGSHESVSVLDLLGDDEAPDSIADADEIRWALERVSRRSADCLRMYFGLDGIGQMTGPQIADYFGRSKSWGAWRLQIAKAELREVLYSQRGG
jgi:DNA-directed RNA polymerase specialized sigma24 family protein